MKIVISATGDGLTAKADPRFGRAPYFILMDESNPDSPRVLKNEAAQAATGAGTEAAQKVIREGAGVVISGAVGPHAFQIFEKTGVQVYLFQGDMTVQEVYDQYKAGNLKRMVIKRL